MAEPCKAAVRVVRARVIEQDAGRERLPAERRDATRAGEGLALWLRPASDRRHCRTLVRGPHDIGSGVRVASRPKDDGTRKNVFVGDHRIPCG